VSLECARILSKPKFPATIIFLTVAGEEQGLNGSQHFAQMAKQQGWNIEAVLNNDIVGGNKGADQEPGVVRVFSEGVPVAAEEKQLRQIRSLGGENDSNSRELARYIADVSRAYETGVTPLLIFRLDRYLRGGDHRSFNQQGFAAVRFTEYREDFNHQHQNVRTENGIEYGDLPKFVDFDYVPTSPGSMQLPWRRWRPRPRLRPMFGLTPASWKMTRRSRGNLRGREWLRSRVAGDQQSQWEHAQNLGNTTRATLKLSKDNVIFAVRAVDNEGHPSLPAVPVPER